MKFDTNGPKTQGCLVIRASISILKHKHIPVVFPHHLSPTRRQGTESLQILKTDSLIPVPKVGCRANSPWDPGFQEPIASMLSNNIWGWFNFVKNWSVTSCSRTILWILILAWKRNYLPQYIPGLWRVCTPGLKRMPMIPPVFASYLFATKMCALGWINHLRSISLATHSLSRQKISAAFSSAVDSGWCICLSSPPPVSPNISPLHNVRRGANIRRARDR